MTLSSTLPEVKTFQTKLHKKKKEVDAATYHIGLATAQRAPQQWLARAVRELKTAQKRRLH
jgi:hypothetical protein